MKLMPALALLAVGIPGLLGAMELQPDAVKCWNDYIRNAGSRMQARLTGRLPFLWIDEASERRSRARNGEIVVAPVIGRGTQAVPDALIHDWIGAVFIPNTTIPQLLAVVHDYDRYKEFFNPGVADSKALDRTDREQSFSMVWQRRILFVNAAVQCQYHANDFEMDARRGYRVVSATRVQQIESYGERSQRLLPPGQGSGFIWRVHSIARYQERDGGVYFELEAIALTRDIPPSVRFFVSPVVNHLSITSLATSLRQTRDAVSSLSHRLVKVACCTLADLNSMVK